MFSCAFSTPTVTDESASICAGRCGMVDGVQCGPCGYGYTCNEEGYCVGITNDYSVRDADEGGLLSDMGEMYADDGNVVFSERDNSPEPDDETTITDEDTELSDEDWAPIDCGSEPFLAKAVSAGWAHTCAIATDGTLWCWGENYGGKLGIGSVERQRCPRQEISGENNWHIISCGLHSTCGIKDDHSLWCWGRNYFGQLGIGAQIPDYTDYSEPQRVGQDNDWLWINVWRIHACAIKSNGYLYCWGGNEYGQLGLGDTVNRNVPVEVGGMWKTVATGNSHTCGVKSDGTLWCWGWNWYGQLGIGEWGYVYPNPEYYTLPQSVTGETRWKEVATGWSHTCAIATDSTLWCWGNNYFGELGIGEKGNTNVPLISALSSGWDKVSAGESQSCGHRDDSLVYCWGHNRDGRLGTGDYLDRRVPEKIAMEKPIKTFTVGRYHACVIDMGNRLYCFGNNEEGQLGLGDTENRSLPTLVTF